MAVCCGLGEVKSGRDARRVPNLDEMGSDHVRQSEESFTNLQKWTAFNYFVKVQKANFHNLPEESCLEISTGSPAE